MDRSENHVSLRPENTAGVVRALLESSLWHQLPQKFFYCGPMFRYERPQKRRTRQFHQFGVEHFSPGGSSSTNSKSLIDAETIELGWRFLCYLPGATSQYHSPCEFTGRHCKQTGVSQGVDRVPARSHAGTLCGQSTYLRS